MFRPLLARPRCLQYLDDATLRLKPTRLNPVLLMRNHGWGNHGVRGTFEESIDLIFLQTCLEFCIQIRHERISRILCNQGKYLFIQNLPVPETRLISSQYFTVVRGTWRSYRGGGGRNHIEIVLPRLCNNIHWIIFSLFNVHITGGSPVWWGGVGGGWRWGIFPSSGAAWELRLVG